MLRKSNDESNEGMSGGARPRGSFDKSGHWVTLTRGLIASPAPTTNSRNQPKADDARLDDSGEKTADENGEAPSRAIVEALQRLMKSVDARAPPGTTTSSHSRGAVIGRVGAETTLEMTPPSSGGRPMFERHLGRSAADNLWRHTEQLLQSSSAPRRAIDAKNGLRDAATRDGRRSIGVHELITESNDGDSGDDGGDGGDGGSGGKRSATRQQVHIHAKPLAVEEMFNGTTNANDAKRLEPAINDEIAYHTTSKSSSMDANGRQRDVHRGGYFTFARPGDRLRLPADVQRELPAEFKALAPELFDGASSGEKTIKKAEKYGRGSGSAPSRSMPRPSSLIVNDDDDDDRRGAAHVDELFATATSVKRRPTPTAESMDAIVVNGRVLTAAEARALVHAEQTSTTSTMPTTTWRPASHLFGASDDQHPAINGDRRPFDNHQHSHDGSSSSSSSSSSSGGGVVNTFLLSGLADMLHEGREEEQQHRKQLLLRKFFAYLFASDRQPSRTHPEFRSTSTVVPPRLPTGVALESTTTTSSPVTRAASKSTTSSTPIVCYRQISQQKLLYATFARHKNVSLNECRCRCAETWLRSDAEFALDETASRCKSVLYNEISLECALNVGDHNGKYDLIFDKAS